MTYKKTFNVELLPFPTSYVVKADNEQDAIEQAKKLCTFSVYDSFAEEELDEVL